MKRGPVYATPRCPRDAAHGGLLDWPTARAAWYCPNAGCVEAPFYTTDLLPVERLTGSRPVSRSAGRIAR